jgi:hypothetical protein
MNKYIKPTKTIVIDGKVYTAVRERNYIPEPEEQPKRVQDEYVLPKHTSLFVKTLEETIELNLESYFEKMEAESESLKKQSLELIMSGDLKKSMKLLQKAKDLDKTIESGRTKLKIAWMSLMLVNYDSLTSQIVTRLK